MGKDIKEIKTYLNRNGYPMLRRCKNCTHWKTEEINDKQGFCTLKPYFFAFTLMPNLYPVTRDFFLCEEHKFFNEELLQQVSESILLIDAIKNKEDID
jgi:hypothetical protein